MYCPYTPLPSQATAEPVANDFCGNDGSYDQMFGLSDQSQQIIVRHEPVTFYCMSDI